MDYQANTREVKTQYRTFILIVAIAAIIGAFFLLLSLFKTTGKIHFINELKAPAQVSFSGFDDFSLASGEKKTFQVKKGKYQITYRVGNEPIETINADISDSALYIVNIGGGAVILWEEAQYSSLPEELANNNYEISRRLYAGESFIQLDKADFEFEEFPVEIKIQGETGVRDRIDLLKGEPRVMWKVLEMMKCSPQQILTYLESHLNVMRDDEDLLLIYKLYSTTAHTLKHSRTFLEKGINLRPVLINWHRVYQELAQTPADKAKVISQYDEMLAKEPNNSALLYLRGRLCTDNESAFSYYDRAIAADEKNAYPYAGKAYIYAGSANLSPALEQITLACQYRPDSVLMQNMRFDLRFALGQYNELEQSIQERLKLDPANITLTWKLLDVYTAQKNLAAARETAKRFEKEYLNSIPSDPFQDVVKTRIKLAYLEKDFNRLEKEAKKLADNIEYEKNLFIVYLNRGQMEKTETLTAFNREADAYECLCYWLGWLDKGRKDKAADWLAKAKEKFAASGDQDNVVAQWLDPAAISSPKGTSMTARLDSLSVHYWYKRILYTAFAKLYPKEQKQLLARARLLNFTYEFPYHFLAKFLST